MKIRLIFSPPQLPMLTSGDDIVAQISGSLAEQMDDDILRLIAEETDEFNRLREAYEQRNAQYAEWIQWRNDNEIGPEQLLAFLHEHLACFDASSESLGKLDVAITASAELSDGELHEELRGMREQAGIDAQMLANNIDVISADT